MYRSMILLAVACLAACLPLSGAIAQDSYLVPAVVYTDDDKHRAVDDEVNGGQLTLGHFLTDHFAVEGVIGMSSLSGTDDLDLLEVGANGVFAFARDRLVSPYLKFGFGFVDADSDLFGHESGVFNTYGAGLNIRFGQSPVALQLEYRARNSSEFDGNPSDTIASAGIRYAFGKKAVPMASPVADSDADGVNDTLDACPDTPAGHRVDSRGCSLDSDGDGVADADDQCPNTYRGAKVDISGCELDDDNDGVVNRLDECPNTAPGARVDIKGCEIRDVINLPGVNFATNSDRLLDGADAVLRDAAATLRKHPDLVIEVAGHTDSDGAADYNEGLSERRAITVRDYLINAGVAADRLSARGYGETVPVADNSSREGKAQNRRVELRIIRQ